MKHKTLLFALTFSAFIAAPKLILAQGPSLGRATGFVVFSSTGAVFNVGNSHLTGDVGAINGAVAVNINIDGVMHVDDAAATNARTDLGNAYTQLNAATPNFFPASPVLGNNTTLTPGVYRINQAGFLNGNLTLNGNGNSNSVFIFQIKGAFNTSANSQVILSNGAVACNVFFVSEDAVDIGSGTIFKGNIIANNAAISAGANVSIDGRLLSTTGAISFTALSARMPLGCSVPVLNGPTAPNLGTTVCYALLSSSGNVTNTGTGTTNVVGDIGTNFGTTSGYNSANVNGTIHTVPDASTQSASNALVTTNSYLTGLAKDIDLLYPAQFGNDLPLTPHTYLLSGTTTLTGNLILNAQDNANAVFVIKVDGTLLTMPSSKVLLINGAQAKNVYWKVTGASTIGALTEFKGTLVDNAAIAFGQGSIINGRALTTSGAISTNSTTATITPGCSPLPVGWLYFRGKNTDKNVLLEWGTTNEVNNDYFTIEKSVDGLKFETLTTIKAAQTTSAETNYSFADRQPYGLTYYRILQTDKDGQKNYFRTIQVKSILTPLTIKPLIRENFVYLQVSGASFGNASVDIFSVDGRKVASQTISISGEAQNYKIDKQLQKGIYLLSVKSNGNKLYSGKIIVK